MSDEILAYARARNVSKIVVGKPGRVRCGSASCSARSSTRSSAGSGEIDVYVISGDRDEPRPLPAPRPGRSRRTGPPTSRRSPRSRCAPAVAWLMFPYFGLSNLIMVYLLGVVGVATRTRARLRRSWPRS